MMIYHRLYPYVYFLCEICEVCNLKINYYYYLENPVFRAINYSEVGLAAYMPLTFGHLLAPLVLRCS